MPTARQPTFTQTIAVAGTWLVVGLFAVLLRREGPVDSAFGGLRVRSVGASV